MKKVLSSIAAFVLGILFASTACAMQPAYNYSDESVKSLLDLLENKDPIKRHCAAIFIGERYRNPSTVVINGPRRKPFSPSPEFPIPSAVIPALTNHLVADPDLRVRVCVVLALGELRFQTNTIESIALGLRDRNAIVRIRACTALIEAARDYGDPLHPAVISTLNQCLDTKGEVEEIWQAAYATELLGTNAAPLVPALNSLTVHESEKVRSYAKRAIRKYNDAQKTLRGK